MATARNSLWTGNNSFTAYSARTTFAMLGIILLGLLLYAWPGARSPVAKRLTIAACLCYGAGLAYDAVIAYWFSHGEAMDPSPWHVQPLSVPVFCAVFAGLSRAGSAGRLVRVAAVWLWAYVIGCTYWVKLIPFYAGYPEPRVRLLPLLRWYSTSLRPAWEMLNLVSLMPAAVVVALGATVVLCAALLAARLTEWELRGAPPA